MVHQSIKNVTENIISRSKYSRAAYLDLISRQDSSRPYRSQLACGNLAHGLAACDSTVKQRLADSDSPNLAIVTAYNDMLSAHQPYAVYPEIIKNIAINCGATAQVAGAVPAMCDGITQGRAGMEMSLFSRDNIAMSTAIALSHEMFDGAVYLGICDKIVPGLLMGAISFGHMPGIFIPAGPMKTGISNKEKSEARQQFARGKITKSALLKVEGQSYHSPGTCTFYGTANSNQMLMEIMGLQLPGSSFEHPESLLRAPLTHHAVKQLLKSISNGNSESSISEIVSVHSIVNAVVGLLATGGSTNHTIHLIAIARAAGIILTWQDMAELSKTIPLLCRVYPNGEADINQFHQAGGMSFLISQLLDAGLLHNDVNTIVGFGLEKYALQPQLRSSKTIAQTSDTSGIGIASAPPNHVEYVKPDYHFLDKSILRHVSKPFAKNGGLTLLQGNLGKAVIKSSAIAKQHQKLSAPALIFQSQQTFLDAFENGELNRDFVAVLIFQGPKSNGMPELHSLTPALGLLQDLGFRVALVTDGRMSGASGKIPAAIHLTPEAVENGPIAKIKNGDIIELDCENNRLSVALTKSELSKRNICAKRDNLDQQGFGRELFSTFRKAVNAADEGATILGYVGG